LADKLDQLIGFFAVDGRPSGSGDPYALRRAALGVVRTIRENGLRISLDKVLEEQAARVITQLYHRAWARRLEELQRSQDQFPPGFVAEFEEAVTAGVIPDGPDNPEDDTNIGRHWRYDGRRKSVQREVLDFLAERLRVQLRAEGARHDLVAAVFGVAPDDDLVRLLARADALKSLIEGPDGPNLLTAYRRAANILRIEDKKDGPHTGVPDPALLRAPEEIALAEALARAAPAARERLAAEDFAGAMAELAALRAPLDAFFDRVTVNDTDKELRRNRLRLLATLRDAMDAVADLSKVEG
jgi:glycyl-tRNA synthetase beta chain